MNKLTAAAILPASSLAPGACSSNLSNARIGAASSAGAVADHEIGKRVE